MLSLLDLGVRSASHDGKRVAARRMAGLLKLRNLQADEEVRHADGML